MCIRRYFSGVSMGALGLPCSRRNVITTTPPLPQQQQQSPQSSSTANLRCYFYYTNERGDLYNVYNTADGFFDTIGTIAKSKKGKDGGGPPLSKKQLQTIPSGPSFLKDRAFLDFFMKNLRVFSTNPKVCRDVSRAKKYEECLLVSSSSPSSSNGGVAPLSSPLSVSPTTTTTNKSVKNNNSSGDDNEVVDTTNDIVVVSAIGDVLAREGLHAHDMFPYVSLCGKELNFIACEKEPIVFYDLTTTSKDNSINNKDGNSNKSSEMVLRFAGTLEEPFVPSSLVVDEEGYLYHPVTTLNTNPPPRQSRGHQQRQSIRNSSVNDDGTSSPSINNLDGDISSRCGVHKQQLGLVGASVGFKLGFEYICEEKDTDGNYVIDWNGTKTPVPLR